MFTKTVNNEHYYIGYWRSTYLIWKTRGSIFTYGNTLFIRLGKTGWKYLSFWPIWNIPNKTRKKDRRKDITLKYKEFAKDEWRVWFPSLSLEYFYSFKALPIHIKTEGFKNIHVSLKTRKKLWSYISYQFSVWFYVLGT